MRTVYVTDPVLTVAFVVALLLLVFLGVLVGMVIHLKRRADDSDHRHALCSSRAGALWECLPEESRRQWSPREADYDEDA